MYDTLEMADIAKFLWKMTIKLQLNSRLSKKQTGIKIILLKYLYYAASGCINNNVTSAKYL